MPNTKESDDRDGWGEYDGSFPVSMRHGFNLFLRPGCSHSERRFRYRSLEANELDLLMTKKFDGFHCLDVGANVGYFSKFLLSKIGPSGSVHAFEPDPISKVILEKNLRDERAKVSSFALGENSQQTSFFSDPTNSGLNSTLALPHASDVSIVEVRTIDDYVSQVNLEKIDFIKIDVQGTEQEVLRGGSAVLFRDKPCIYLELDSTYDHFGEKVEFRIGHLERVTEIRDSVRDLGAIYRVSGNSFVELKGDELSKFSGNVIINPPEDWLDFSFALDTQSR
jgi:FkbM family methyltransferase